MEYSLVFVCVCDSDSRIQRQDKKNEAASHNAVVIIIHMWLKYKHYSLARHIFSSSLFLTRSHRLLSSLCGYELNSLFSFSLSNRLNFSKQNEKKIVRHKRKVYVLFTERNSGVAISLLAAKLLCFIIYIMSMSAFAILMKYFHKCTLYARFFSTLCNT